MSFRLKVLGGAALEGESGPLSGPAVQRHRLALLALLAVSRTRSVSRDKLMAWLWPERETEPARRLLNQAVHALRHALGPEAILSSGDELQFNSGLVRCDVIAFEDAVAGREPERAATLYTGPFLDGFFLDEAPEFAHWVDRERDRLAGAYAKTVEGLAEAAERGGDPGAAVEWWKMRASHDPYDSRVALRLMRALERAGNRAGALQHVALHQRLLREEMRIEPSSEVLELMEELRRETTPPVARARGKDAVPSSAVAPPAEIVAEPVRPEPRQGVPEVPALRRRVLRYAAAVILLGVATEGAIRLAARSSAVASPKMVDEIAHVQRLLWCDA